MDDNKSKPNLNMKPIVLTILAYVLLSPIMAETTDAIVYKVRLANGADQYYQIVVSANVPPAKAVKWATPSVASNQLSAQGAKITAVECQRVKRAARQTL